VRQKEPQTGEALRSVVHINISKATIVTAILLEACVTNISGRKNNTAKDTVSVAVRLPLYPLEITQRLKILFANLFPSLKKRVL
jgi:hypothetical protein